LKIYIAGCFESRPRLAQRRNEIEGLGHTVTSSWLDEPDQDGLIVLPSPEACLNYAVRDLGEIRQSELLLIDTLDVNARGGREVELGFALRRLQTWLVGPRRNVFHYLVDKWCSSWEIVLEQLAGLESR